MLQQAVSFAQSDGDTTVPRQDSGVIKKDSTAPKEPVKKDTIVRTTPVKRDSSAPIKPVITTSDSNVITRDTVELTRSDTTRWYSLKGFMAVLKEHPYFNFFGKPMRVILTEKKSAGKDALFYFMSGLLIYYGLMRLFFGKYINNLLALFFRATMRQQQIRDQLLQSPLPSLFLNFLFLVNGGLFLTFVLLSYHLSPITNMWILLPWCSALLLAVYLGKFIILKITGWIFNVTAATDTYIFIVFLVNKMIGIVLLPVLVVMAFANAPIFSVMQTLTFMLLVFLLGYRFLISYNPIRNEIKVNRFHFFLYLCAFEIAPLLLIYKVLLIFLERSH